MGYFHKLAKSAGWSAKKINTPQAGESLHFSHPQHGTVSIVQEGGNYHVKHNGAYAGVLNQKGIFSNANEAVAHAKKYIDKLKAGGQGNIMHNMPSGQSSPVKAHLQPLKQDIFKKNEDLDKAKVDTGLSDDQKRINRSIRNWKSPKSWKTGNPAHEGQFHGTPKTPSTETSGVHQETGTFTTGGYKTFKDRSHKNQQGRDKLDIQASHTMAMRGLKNIKPNLPKSEDESEKKDTSAPRHDKGVHRSFAGKGRSIMGLANRGIWSHGDKAQSKKTAVGQHEKVMAEMAQIKPNLPKSELTKAKVDEKLSFENKSQQRQQRQETPTHPAGTTDRMHPQGKNTAMGKIARMNKLRAYRKLPPKDLGKAAQEYFTLRKHMANPDHQKLPEHCPEDMDPKINHDFTNMILSRMSGPSMQKDESTNGGPQKEDLGAQNLVTPQKTSRSYDLLTDEAANAKTAKSGRRGGYLSAILHLAPADLAGGKNVCPFATEGCRHACLNTSGRGGMLDKEYSLNDIQLARVRRTKEFHDNPHAFLARINNDIDRLKNHARAEGKVPVVRLNGTSDINWAALKSHHLGDKNLFDAHPDVQFYDYTKNPYIIRNNKHSNYHITFSHAETPENQQHAKELLAQGHNVAVVFGGKKNGKVNFPRDFLGHEVISGDDTDLRFLDPKGGKVIGLSAKGDAMHDTSGFVQWGHAGEPDARPKPKPEAGRYERIKGANTSPIVEAYKRAKAGRKSSPEALKAKIAKLQSKLDKLKGK